MEQAKTTLIAEIGSVHDGSLGNAKRLIDAAAAVGADVVKFQTHLAEAETTRDAPNPPYFTDESRWEYFKRTAFTKDQWVALKEHCEGRGVSFISSPFSIEAVDLLEEVGVGGYKVASGEVTNKPLLERIAGTGKEVYLSSGMSSWEELDDAVQMFRSAADVVVMQATSEYPCPPERVGLNVLMEMRERYKLPIGLSDHTLGIAAPLAAVALGATVVEKHLAFSRQMYGSDAAHSLEPGEWKAMASAIRELEVMMHNSVDKDDLTLLGSMKTTFEKSVVAARDLPSGTMLAREDLAYKKPGDGFPASRYAELLGRSLTRPVSKDQRLEEADLA
jgi:N-acetylneuraminate synthase